MNALKGRLVVVPADSLGELLELASLVAERLPDVDPLTSAVRAAAAQVRTSALLEP